MRKIYVASSWRNERQPEVVRVLRESGHEVYNFRNSAPANHGFHWSEIDPDWQSWSGDRFIAALNHPIARSNFATDFDAMHWADTLVLVMPCGRSAHLEAGWAMGAGKTVAILVDSGEPELMYRMAIATGGCVRSLLREIVEWLR